MKDAKKSNQQYAFSSTDTAPVFFARQAKKDICLQMEDSLFQLERDMSRFHFVLKELRENFYTDPT